MADRDRPEPMIRIGARKAPPISHESRLSPIVSLPQHAPWTEAALNLGATIVDRLECFEDVLRILRCLREAIANFNDANASVEVSLMAYQAVEEHYRNRPQVLSRMKALVDAVISPCLASSSRDCM
jgi:hypothetical protein